MSQQSRRHDPYPWTWEVPVGVMLVIFLVLVCGVHLGARSPMRWAGWLEISTLVELVAACQVQLRSVKSVSCASRPASRLASISRTGRLQRRIRCTSSAMRVLESRRARVQSAPARCARHALA